MFHATPGNTAVPPKGFPSVTGAQGLNSEGTSLGYSTFDFGSDNTIRVPSYQGFLDSCV